LLNLQVRHPHFLSDRDYTHDKGKPSIADLRAGTAVMVMKKGVPIEGRVVDADGKPVVGARIISTDNRFSLYQDVGRFAVSTGPDGRFRTGQVKPGEWAIVATAKGRAPALQRVEIVTETPFFEMRLGKPHSFKGRVVDTNGNPVAGAFIDIDTWREVRCLGAMLWTDADGRFRWDDAPDDELTINVSSRGYRGLFQQKTFASEDDVVLKLEPSLRIVGKVRDSVHKKRVEAARVEYGAVDEAKGEPAVWVPMPQLGSSTGVYQGELDINFPISAEFYRFRLKSSGYQTFVSRVFRSDEVEVWDYDITLEPEANQGE
jgi:hypothetical protein